VVRAVLLQIALALLASVAGRAAETPDRVLATEDFSLRNYAGKVVLVDFWASWCKPCALSLPWLSKLAATYCDEGLVVVAVNVDKKLAAAESFLAVLDPRVVVVHDSEGKLAAAHELEGMPSSFLYDRTGKLRAQHVGFLPAEAANREQAVTDLLHEEATPDAH